MNRLLVLWTNRSLGVRLGVIFGGMTLLLAVVVGETAGRRAQTQIEQETGQDLTFLAFQMSKELNRNLFERYREIQIIAGLEPFGQASAPPAAQPPLLDRLQSTYPHYSWIGFAAPQGEVISSTQGMLQGQIIAQRDWFQAALVEPFVGDVHEAVLLAKLLPNPRGSLLRFVDVAAPVFNAQGELQGALLGPTPWQGETLNLQSLDLSHTRPKGYVVETWPNGHEYLVGFGHPRSPHGSTQSGSLAQTSGSSPRAIQT